MVNPVFSIGIYYAHDVWIADMEKGLPGGYHNSLKPYKLTRAHVIAYDPIKHQEFLGLCCHESPVCPI